MIRKNDSAVAGTNHVVKDRSQKSGSIQEYLNSAQVMHLAQIIGLYVNENTVKSLEIFTFH